MTPPLVLVVEDDLGVRQLLETVLGGEGFAVQTAGDGQEGLSRLESEEPAALVLDVRMPDLDGIAVLDDVLAKRVALPVIVVTGAHDEADASRRRLGAENVFDKPFDVDALVARVRAVAGDPEDS